MKTTAALAITLLTLISVPASAAVMFDWATVGNPNVDDTTGYGGVDYTYRISKHEVTNAQYTEFLNAVAATDTYGPYGLYNPGYGPIIWYGITRSGTSGSYTYSVTAPAAGQGPGGTDYTYDSKPVVFVWSLDAMRFVNWLHNGQGAGDTETGVYNISDGVSETRSANARYFIPSEDEWYKAAYYDPNSSVYYDYPTSTDTVPNNNLPSADTGNSANYGNTTGNLDYPATDVGAYSLSESPYGTFDQGGNVWEWNEAVISNSFYSYHVARGGSYFLSADWLRADVRYNFDHAPGNVMMGFRVASSVIPEPSTMLMGALAAAGLLVWRRR